MAMLCVFLLAVPVVLAEEVPGEMSYEIPQAHIELQATIILASMDEGISYAQELGATDDELNQLENIKLDFESLTTDVSEVESREALTDLREQMKEIVTEFREDLGTLVESYDGSLEELRERMSAVHEDNADIAAARAAFIAVLEDHLQEKYNTQLDKMEEIHSQIVDMYADNDAYDLTELESILESYRSYDLDAAVQTGNPEEIREATEELVSYIQAFREEIASLFGELEAREQAVHVPEFLIEENRFQFFSADRFLEMMESTIEDLQDAGYDVSSLEAEYQEAQTNVEDARAAIDNGEDPNEALSYGQAFRENLQDFIEALTELVGVDSEYVESLEAQADAL